MKKVQLSKYDNSWYKPGSFPKRSIWYFTNWLVFKTSFPFPSAVKVWILKAFGAKVRKNVVIKPNVNIKYPWFLEIGDNVWIGEGVWIDNLCEIKIGSDVCISQGAYIFTGNHDYKKETFDLIVKPVIIEDGTWIGAKAAVCPGIVVRSHSIVTAGSVLTKSTEPYGVYKGNPAEKVKTRVIE